MRKLLMTTALVLPILALPVLAQQTQPPPIPPAGTDAPPPADAPATDAPATDAPAADAPATDAPPADPPATDAPPADPPATDAPPADPPVTDAPPADPPVTDAPPADPPAMDAPAADAPAADAPPADAPAMDAPAADAPPADAPAMDAPAADAAPADAATAPLLGEQGGTELRGDWVIGTSVTSLQDESIGSIQDIIIDEEDGRVTAAILSVGGFLGIGAKNIAVDWNELQMSNDAREIRLGLTREEAEAAPEYTFRDRAEAPAAVGTDAPLGGPAPGAPPPPAN